ncbi:MAG: hypothetical protein HZC41_17825 [Chloroflexi bacterium]|nr:hypothetical protein [Chloroflexota bacterium]
MMFRRIDRSPFLARWIERLSTFLARRRGLPVVIGILLVVVSFVLQVVDVYAVSQALRLLAVVFQNVGILLALIGLLLAEPLGK